MKYMISKELAEQAWKLLNEGKEKKVFSRGDFDSWKISDEELEECQEYIKKSGNKKVIKKILVHKKDGRYYWRNQQVNSFVYDSSKKMQQNEDPIQFKRIMLANKSKFVIKNVKPLNITRSNFKQEIMKAYIPIENAIIAGNVTCNCINKKVVGVNKTHEYLKKDKKAGKYKIRDFVDMQNHANYIPFIIPVLEHGIYDPKMDRNKNGLSHEIVCRARITEDGKKKNIGVSVVVYETSNGLEVKKVSVFRMKDNYRLIKSRTIVPDGIDRSLVNGFDKSIKHNSIIPDSTNKSTPKPAYNGQNVRNKSEGRSPLNSHSASRDEIAN